MLNDYPSDIHTAGAIMVYAYAAKLIIDEKGEYAQIEYS